jgi:hypothetical protein
MNWKVNILNPVLGQVVVINISKIIITSILILIINHNYNNNNNNNNNHCDNISIIFKYITVL